GLEPDLTAAVEIDGKTSADDHEQLIGSWMTMPAIGLLEHGEPQAAIVDLADDHVSIGLRDRRAFLREIDDLECREFHALVGVVLYYRIRDGCHWGRPRPVTTGTRTDISLPQ